jgi:hypothetical protein
VPFKGPISLICSDVFYKNASTQVDLCEGGGRALSSKLPLHSHHQRLLKTSKLLLRLDLYLERSSQDILSRPCRGIDEIRTAIEIRVSQQMGTQTIDIDTTEISCSAAGVNSTISFITFAGQAFGKYVVSLGVGGLNSVLNDPLGYRYNLTLMEMIPTWNTQDEGADAPPPNDLYLYGDKPRGTDYPPTPKETASAP